MMPKKAWSASVLRVLAGIGVVAGLASFGCGTDDRNFTLEFDTAVEDGMTRAQTWFLRNGYDFPHGGARETSSEKRRPLASGGGDQIDVLLVKFRRDAASWHVTIQAFTDLDDEHGRRRAPQVWNEARADAEALARELMAPRAG